ncbi:MAG: purine phosphoribosyltransferase family protein [Thermoplasmatales archaeon]|nr:MAG: purine phosphoribosyltransferase family protein [Thermoplasmatales archaeon]
MSLDYLKKSLKQAPIVKKGDYYYVVHPITDGVPEIKPELLKEVTNEIKRLIKNCGKIDKIVTMEAMGIPLASILAMEMNLPFNIIRKREYGLPDEISVGQVTGYSKSKLFINGLKKGDTIVIVDDVLSTGGTLRAVLSALKKIGVIIEGVFIAVDKGNCAQKISEEFDVQINVLVTIDVVKGDVVIKS